MWKTKGFDIKYDEDEDDDDDDAKTTMPSFDIQTYK